MDQNDMSMTSEERTDIDTIDTIPPPVPTRRLVRDPHAAFGGVASGIAHYFGWDVSLTRLGTVLLFVATGGLGVLVYLLAWIIIPRATHWPPPGAPRRPTRFSTRDLGLGLAAVGVLFALMIVGGRPGAVLVPVALIAGGVWLLSKDPRAEGTPESTGPDTPDDELREPAPGSAPPILPPVSVPAPPRSRRRRLAIAAFAFAVVVALLALVAIPVGLVLAARSGNLDLDPDRVLTVEPATVDELPATIAEDEARVVLDLLELDADSFVGVETPVELTVDIDVGEIAVLVPEEIRVDIEASTAVGEVALFGSETDGFFAERTFAEADPHLRLDLHTDLGSVVVERP